MRDRSRRLTRAHRTTSMLQWVCASRACMGSRNTSRNAAASGARHAHAVICSASGGRWWPKAEKKMVPRTATPSALESCCTASKTPESGSDLVHAHTGQNESEQLPDADADADEAQAGGEIPG
jgi:hypothetical protein